VLNVSKEELLKEEVWLKAEKQKKRELKKPHLGATGILQ
jgi:hypothetical protein